MASFIVILASFGLGFSACLLLLGRSEQEQMNRIQELEKENQELKVTYLDSCWKSNDNN